MARSRGGEGPEESGPTLKVESRPGQPGQIYSVALQRETATFVGRAVLKALTRRDARVVVEASQTELQMVLQTDNDFVSREGASLVIRPSKPDHKVNDVPFDLDLNWEDVSRPDFTAKLKFEVMANSKISTWTARALIWVRPTVRELRKVSARV